MLYTLFLTAVGVLSGLLPIKAASSLPLEPGLSHEGGVPQTCQANILSYEQLNLLSQPDYSLHLKGLNGGQLHYLGVSHTNNPSHPQFDRLLQNFEEIQPTLIFYEGPRRSLPSIPAQVIPLTGEAGFMQYLAQHHGIPTAQLEPPRQAEITALLDQFTPEQVKLFYVLRQVAELRDRWQTSSVSVLHRSVVPILQQFSKFDGLKHVITDVEELETTYRRYWQTPTSWWQAPSQWFNPVLSTESTGGQFTNDLHRAASNYRNQHMVNVLATAINQGHRVMAVVGQSHVPMQAQALRCAVES